MFPQVLVPLCDLLEDGAILEPLVREPEIIPVLRGPARPSRRMARSMIGCFGL